MRRVDFQNALALRQVLLAHGLHHAFHLCAHGVFAGHEAAGAIFEAARHADFLDVFVQDLLQVFAESLEDSLVGFFGLLFVFGLFEIHVAASDVVELLVAEFGEARHHELVDAVAHEQDFVALGLEGFEHRVRLHGVLVADEVVDFLLAFRHALHVFVEAHESVAFGLGAFETEQLLEFVKMFPVHVEAFLQDHAEFAPPGVVLGSILVGHVLQGVEHLLDDVLTDVRDDLVVLQDFTGHVQRQVFAIHHAAHKAEPRRQQVLAVVHDKDFLHVELEAVQSVIVPDVERGLRRNVDEAPKFLGTFGVAVAPGGRFVGFVADDVVEILVLFFGDFLFALAPQSLLFVQAFFGLFFHFALVVLGRFRVEVDAVAHESAVLLDNILDLPFAREVFGVFVILQVQSNLGADLVERCFRNLEVAGAFGGPQVTLLLAGLQGQHFDLLRDHEHGVETHTELADQIDATLVAFLQVLDEVLGAATGDGAEAVDQVFLVHADTVVFDNDALAFLVHRNVDAELRALRKQVGVREREETALVECVRRVRNELAEEDFLVAIKGVDHQVQHVANFCLEFHLLCCHFTSLCSNLNQKRIFYVSK